MSPQSPPSHAPTAAASSRPLVRPPRAVRALRVINYMIRSKLGLAARLETVDRSVLEDIILPFYAVCPEVQRVLFVGCAPFTRHYEAIFPGRDYTTIDQDPRCRRFGAARHIVDKLENLDRHVAPVTLDLIICNGVFGWGLDERVACEAAFAACARALRPGGVLLIGWNDISSRRPIALEDLEALRLFRPIEFEALGTSQYLTATRNRHTFNFYERPQ